MTILNKTPITLAETKDIVDKLEGKEELKEYLKKFTPLKKDKALDLKKNISDLNNPKIKEENVVKIVDFLPKDAEDINKILIDVSLSEEEINAITEITKRY